MLYTGGHITIRQRGETVVKVMGAKPGWISSDVVQAVAAAVQSRGSGAMQSLGRLLAEQQLH